LVIWIGQQDNQPVKAISDFPQKLFWDYQAQAGVASEKKTGQKLFVFTVCVCLL